ncbi:hypothetical protein [Dendrosporobacter sp. 1207_IL3150]|uniref:hypothetical protein n=1 Tax=Dendrosporobacter sp. 1207_IL3150 TaxID=3084054 RepID=UPI002FD9701D
MSDGDGGSKQNSDFGQIASTEEYWLDERGYRVSIEENASKILKIDLDEDDNVVRVTLIPKKKVIS